MQTTHDFRKILRDELERRINRNARYSLRAFAKDLAMPPPLLSDVLNGRRGLSRASAGRIARKIGLSPEETQVFCDLVEVRHARSRAAKEKAGERLRGRRAAGKLGFMTIDSDRFRLIADWYHFAILEMLKMPAESPDPERLARRLGLQRAQAENALGRLRAFGFVREESGRLVASSDSVQAPDGIPSQAMKSHHEQILRKAGEALHLQSLDERDFRGLTVKCRRADVPAVRERIRAFLRELDADLSVAPDADEVYQFSTQFFRLTVPLNSEGVSHV